MSRFGFLIKGMRMVCLNQEGESLVDKLTILVGARTGRHVFNREVHSGSKFQAILLFLKLTLNNNGGQMLMLSSGGVQMDTNRWRNQLVPLIILYTIFTILID